MTKKNQKIYKYAVSWLKSIGHKPNEIITELEIDEATLKALSEDIENPSNGKEPLVKKMMTSNTTNKKNNITVMSKEASELTDSLKKNTVSTNRNTSEFIFKPNNQ
jgi:hypothetical protein